MIGYDSEADLVREFVGAIQSPAFPLRAADVAQEFFYGSGRVDVIVVSITGEVVAVEAKLSKWRTALHQAYRNTCFAHHSYVLLPWAIAERAALYLGEFEQRRVGLCALRNGELIIVHDAPRVEPIQPWLAERAVAHARDVAGSRVKC